MTLREYIEITNYNKFRIAKSTEKGLEILLEFDELKINSKYISDDILNQELDLALLDMNEENENVLENIILIIKE